MKYNNFKHLLFILLPVILLGSCKPKNISGNKVKKRSAKYLLKKIDKNKQTIDWFAAKTKVQFTGPDKKRQSVTANIRMKSDSAIWVSVTPLLGIEMVRVLITPNDFKVLDRLNRKYYEYQADDIVKMVGYPVDFDLVKNALLGETLMPFDKPKTTIDGKQYFLEELVEKVVHRLWLNPEDFSYNKMQLFDEAASRRLDVILSNYENFGDYRFPQKRVINVLSPEVYNMEINYSKLKFNEAQDLKFKVSSRYEKVD